MTKGQRIKKRREELNIKQIELAEAVKISKQTLYKYENDIITNIPSDAVEAIASALKTTPDYIMGWDGFPSVASGHNPPTAVAVKIPDKQNDKAARLYDLYEQAPPEIQAAIDTLLKANQSGS